MMDEKISNLRANAKAVDKKTAILNKIEKEELVSISLNDNQTISMTLSSKKFAEIFNNGRSMGDVAWCLIDSCGTNNKKDVGLWANSADFMDLYDKGVLNEKNLTTEKLSAIRSIRGK